EGLFLGAAEELARSFVRERIEYVVADALEGYNPTHDMCRSMVDAAVALAGVQLHRVIESFEFPLTGRPDVCDAHLRERAIWIELNDEELQRKLHAAQEYTELAEEVTATLASVGVQPFRVECLRPSSPTSDERFAREAPAYERFGEAR